MIPGKVNVSSSYALGVSAKRWNSFFGEIISKTKHQREIENAVINWLKENLSNVIDFKVDDDSWPVILTFPSGRAIGQLRIDFLRQDVQVWGRNDTWVTERNTNIKHVPMIPHKSHLLASPTCFEDTKESIMELVKYENGKLDSRDALTVVKDQYHLRSEI